MQQLVNFSGDAAIAGGYSSGSTNHGYILGWRPADNQVLYTLLVDAAVSSLALDASSNLYFGAAPLPTGEALIAGVVDPAGQLAGSLARISLPPNTQGSIAHLLPTGNGDFWVAYWASPMAPYYGPGSVYAARISSGSGKVLVNRRVANEGYWGEIALTSNGNLKLLVQAPAANETTTADAQLVGYCNTSYFEILSPAGQLVYASYVSDATFDFARQDGPSAPQPMVGCFENAANHEALVSAAPGELITVIGGGFGPLAPAYTSPDSDGKYPLSAGGFRVRIGEMEVPILAVARGSVTVQFPYEIAPMPLGNSSLMLDVFDNDQPLNSIPFSVATASFGLFDNGDRNNAANLPALAALNEDGSVNSPEIPRQPDRL